MFRVGMQTLRHDAGAATTAQLHAVVLAQPVEKTAVIKFKFANTTVGLDVKPAHPEKGYDRKQCGDSASHAAPLTPS